MTDRDEFTGAGPRSGSPGSAGIEALVERAFRYRGDVTVWIADGSPVTGYLFDRNARAGEPYVRLFEAASGDEVSMLYRNITDIQFTGQDAASASVQRFREFQGRQDSRPQADPVEDHSRAE